MVVGGKPNRGRETSRHLAGGHCGGRDDVIVHASPADKTFQSLRSPPRMYDQTHRGASYSLFEYKTRDTTGRPLQLFGRMK